MLELGIVRFKLVARKVAAVIFILLAAYGMMRMPAGKPSPSKNRNPCRSSRDDRWVGIRRSALLRRTIGLTFYPILTKTLVSHKFIFRLTRASICIAAEPPLLKESLDE